jgi:hypothetical protein
MGARNVVINEQGKLSARGKQTWFSKVISHRLITDTPTRSQHPEDGVLRQQNGYQTWILLFAGKLTE